MNNKLEKENNNFKVLNNWIELQKNIKEKILIKENFSQLNEKNIEKIKESYTIYYNNKLNSREILENLYSINQNSKKKNKKYILNDNIEKILGNAYSPICKLLNILRNNYDYIIKIFYLIEENYDINNNKEISSLIDFFCHFFYDNIFIENSKQEELLILIYFLLDYEISNMNSAKISFFLNENFSIVGKFLKSYLKKQDLKNYVIRNFEKFIKNIENEITEYDTLNIFIIQDYINQNKNEEKNNNLYIEDYKKLLFENIPDFKIDFKNDESIFKEKNIEKYSEKISLKNNISKDEFENKNINYINNKNLDFNIIEKEKNKLNNKNYLIDIDQEYISSKILNENDNNLKEFYYSQLKLIYRDPKIFTYNKLIENIFNCDKNNETILLLFKNNFLKIQNHINYIIQKLINHISTIPYTLRCICNIIFKLINKKFSTISKYQKNSFIGEFFFCKYIIPIIFNLDINTSFIDTIISNDSKNYLFLIAKILIKISNGQLFESNKEMEYTVFNYYIIEVIQILNKFYDKLIDIQLPNNLNDLINNNLKRKQKSILKYLKQKNEIFENKNNFEQVNIKSSDYQFKYNFFKENNEDLINVQCICFCLEDILFLVKLLNENNYNNIYEFKDCDKFNFFKKTIELISSEEFILTENIEKSHNSKDFFLFFSIENNQKYIEKEENKIIDDNKDINNSFILNQIKLSIKILLTELNILNIKDYPYFIYANSNYKFFISLYKTLKDINPYLYNKSFLNIPLNWYSRYIYNYLEKLDYKYIKDDYINLFNEIKFEENKKLKNLKSNINIVFIKNGLNFRNIENFLEKINKEFNYIKKFENKYIIEKFINESEIVVCFNFFYDFNLNTYKYTLISKKKEIQSANIIKNITNFKKNNNEKELETLKNIYDFIKQFTKKNSELKEYIKNNIKECKHNILFDNLFENYIDFVIKKLKKDFFFENKKISEDEQLNIILLIENFIHIKIYDYIFPEKPIDKDIEFYNKTKQLDFVTLKDFDVEFNYIDELIEAEKYMKIMEYEKGINNKFLCIVKAYEIINNLIKFNINKDKQSGADEFIPIFQYIVIKTQPKRFFSNIYYIKNFLNKKRLKGEYGFLLSQLEFSSNYILELDMEKIKQKSK